MEANPGATEHQDFSTYYEAGINRISLGVQSFDPVQLNLLGRIHTVDDIYRAVEEIKRGGFNNFNIDLMFGLPGQTESAAQEDLAGALSLAPQHVSLYQLTLEPNTVFHRYPPLLPSTDNIFGIQQSLQHTLSERGLAQYEVSAYCYPGFRCRHNTNYWGFGDYIGIGAGAHGKITSYNGQGFPAIRRRARKKHPASYLNSVGTSASLGENRAVAENDILLEFLMNALRLKDGFELSQAQLRTGIAPAQIVSALQSALEKRLITQDSNRIRCSSKGFLFIDSILETLL